MTTVPRTGWLPGLVLLVILAACGPSTRPLAHAQPSEGDLTSAVLAALERRDEAALRALAISEDEFRDQVWPELPAARAERNLPMAYVWQDLRQKSDAGLARTLAAHGGRRYRLERVEFKGGTTQYSSFVVHRDTVAVLVDERGARTEVRLFGSILAKDGGVKVFSYVVD